LQFPRSALPLPERGLRELSAVRIRGDQGIGALASQYLLELARRLEQFSAAEAWRVSTLTLDVLTAALASALEAGSAVPPGSRGAPTSAGPSRDGRSTSSAAEAGHSAGRAGHGANMMSRVYAKCGDGQRDVADQRIEDALAA
jgi:hypothetical protein